MPAGVAFGGTSTLTALGMIEISSGNSGPGSPSSSVFTFSSEVILIVWH